MRMRHGAAIGRPAEHLVIGADGQDLFHAATLLEALRAAAHRADEFKRLRRVAIFRRGQIIGIMSLTEAERGSVSRSTYSLAKVCFCFKRVGLGEAAAGHRPALRAVCQPRDRELPSTA